MKIIRSRSVGFFSDFCTVIRNISNFEYKKEPWGILWGGESCYYDPQYGHNVWEYYFEPTSASVGNDTTVEFPELKLLDGKNFRETMHYYINKFVKLNNTVTNILKANDEGFKKNNVLGVHIRRTDKFDYVLHYEPTEAEPVSLDKIEDVIDKLLCTKKYNKIYLATDDTECYEKFKTKYDKKIISIDAFRSSGKQCIHFNHKNISGYKKGLDALLDCIFLSKCSFLVRSTSNLSTVSQFFNPDLKHINVNEIFNGDKREEAYNLISEKI